MACSTLVHAPGWGAKHFFLRSQSPSVGMFVSVGEGVGVGDDEGGGMVPDDVDVDIV